MTKEPAMMTDDQLRSRVGKKVICASRRCTSLRQASVLGVLRDDSSLETTHALRREPGGIVCLRKRGGKRQTNKPLLLPRGVRVRCYHCERLLDLAELEADNFA